MPRIHSPRRGSMAYSPRSRAARPYPRLRSQPFSSEPKLLSFAGYKAGMTHTFVTDTRKDTATSGVEVFTPVTIIECPPLTPFLIRAYEKTPYGYKVAGDMWASNLSKNLSRKIDVPQKTPSSIFPQKFDLLTLVCHTNPPFKKTPEVMECTVGGKTIEEQFAKAKELLGKNVKVSDVFRAGDMVDAVAVTKGKGNQGVVKRFHVMIQNTKAQKSGKGRHVGTLGNRSHAVRFTVPMAGNMGFNVRTDCNKRIIKISSEPITPPGGFPHYGEVRTEYMLIKGSVPGSRKRLVRFKPAQRSTKPLGEPQVTHINMQSKQGR